MYRRYREQNIVQGKPRKFKQTQGSVRSSTEFGLCSSAAAVIRRAFEPAFIHRDGEACSRTTTQVYRALRSSLSGSPGQRDLHDADLQELVGMEFNGKCKLAEVLQLNRRITRDEEGNIEVHLGEFKPLEDVRKLPGSPSRASRYRIRLMAIAFDFRREYLEYLDMQDVDVHGWKVMEEQTIRLKAEADPGCMVLVSMSLLLYDEVAHTREYVLLNNKGFSPCAIIGAYPAEEAEPRTASPLDISREAYPERCYRMRSMGYEGNRLLSLLARKFKHLQEIKPINTILSSKKQISPGRDHPGEISFNKKIGF